MSDAQTPPHPPVPPVPPVPPYAQPTPPSSATPQPYAGQPPYASQPPYAQQQQYVAPTAPAPAQASYPPAGYGTTAVYPPAGYAAFSPERPQRPAGPSTLGLIAMIAGIAAIIISVALSAASSFASAEGAMRHAIGMSPEGLENLTEDELLALLSPVRDLVLWAEIGFWLGTALGIWAIVQGIFAIVTRRGRGFGIGAVVIGALGPILWSVVVGFAIIIGIAAGTT
ncbi:MAG: hypothetical protein DI566_01180 [Microbacterium sp.]|nr:MAG: hypothetical protein DI566_01180 [Microbacterium sp.]